MVHEGGYRIKAIAASEEQLGKQFSAQRRKDDLGMFSVEEELRNDRVSFDKVRSLSLTRYRFCVLDSEGQELNDRPATIDDESAGRGRREYLVDAKSSLKSDREFVAKPFNPFDSIPVHSTRVEWGM